MKEPPAGQRKCRPSISNNDYKDGNLVPAGKEETMQERRDLLETVQGYVILKAATFETGHGFALGHNPGAPSPFVTWQFTEGENGHRDYYWAAMEPVRRGRRGTLTAGWTIISTFTMQQSKIQSWARMAFTATIPPSALWT